jgi:hypothetical protein
MNLKRMIAGGLLAAMVTEPKKVAGFIREAAEALVAGK